MIIRKSGFYWCLKGCIWDVNYWSGGKYGEWWIAGSECTFNDDYFNEIDESRVIRIEANS